ncbi:MAG: cyclodeaminase/cyclohydrolase family protein [Candidatus Acetothermia bacterium]|nr:cyclodeaminase/cyclohydrolase family protein [Candidatus Acetothermia bacterium]
MTERSLRAIRVEEFLVALGSSDPTPGGGAAAALSGALAAALAQMVIGLAHRRAKDPVASTALATLQERARALVAGFLDLADADVAAYGAVAAALRLPRGTSEEQERRRAAVQTALKQAAAVPLGTAGRAVDVLSLVGEVAAACPKSAQSDLAAAARLAWAACSAALDNVDANALYIEDHDHLRGIAGVRRDLALEAKKKAAQVLVPLEKELERWLGERDSNPH